MKNRKAAGLNEIPPEVWKTRKFDDILLRFYNTVNTQNKIEKMDKRLHSSLPARKLT